MNWPPVLDSLPSSSYHQITFIEAQSDAELKQGIWNYLVDPGYSSKYRVTTKLSFKCPKGCKWNSYMGATLVLFNKHKMQFSVILLRQSCRKHTLIADSVLYYAGFMTKISEVLALLLQPKKDKDNHDSIDSGGDPLKPHDIENCEACKYGLCKRVISDLNAISLN